MKKRYQKYALSLLSAALISLLLCLGLAKWFVIDLPFKDLAVMAAIVIILKMMNKVLNLSYFKQKSTNGASDWLKQLLEVLVMSFGLVVILSGLSLIGYETLSFKKSLLLVIAAVPGIEFFLIARRCAAKTTPAAAPALSPDTAAVPTTVPDDSPELEEKSALPEEVKAE